MKYLTHSEVQLAELGVHTPQERARMVIARAKGGDLPGGGDVRYNPICLDAVESGFCLHQSAVPENRLLRLDNQQTSSGAAFCVSEVRP